MKSRNSAIAFGLVVVLGAAQVAWWIVFQLRESDRFARAAQAVAGGDMTAAVTALGVREDGHLDDRFHRQRRMFIAEGAFLGLCALMAVAFFYANLQRERRVMRERERFLAGATHEFKTPLATIKLGLESLAADRVPAEKQPVYMASMVDEVDRLERGLSNLLAAAGLRGTTARVQLTPGDLIDDLSKAIVQFRSRFDAAGVEFVTDLPDRIEVARDPAAIRVVIHNLFDNALRYSERGDRVLLTASIENGRAVVRVADTGRGIAKAELRRVFDPFFRGAGGAHRGGSGLGLHLVREFVQMHGGSVTAHSDGVGAGSEFRVSLPLERRTADDAAVREGIA